MGPNGDEPALVQVKICHQTGHNPLSEPIMTLVNETHLSYGNRRTETLLVKIMACHILAPSQYLNQCWLVVNLTLRNQFQWNSNKNMNISFPQNSLKMLSAKQWEFLSNQAQSFLSNLSHTQCIFSHHIDPSPKWSRELNKQKIELGYKAVGA